MVSLLMYTRGLFMNVHVTRTCTETMLSVRGSLITRNLHQGCLIGVVWRGQTTTCMRASSRGIVRTVCHTCILGRGGGHDCIMHAARTPRRLHGALPTEGDSHRTGVGRDRTLRWSITQVSWSRPISLITPITGSVTPRPENIARGSHNVQASGRRRLETDPLRTSPVRSEGDHKTTRDISPNLPHYTGGGVG